MLSSELEKEKSCFKELKTRVKADKDLQKFATILDDAFLLHFVRGRKYDPKRAYSTLKNYMANRSDKYKDTFKNLRPSKLPLLTGLIRVFKHKDPVGRIMGIIQVEQWDLTVCNIEQLTELVILYLEEAWNDIKVERQGMIVIVDGRGFSFEHAKQATPGHVTKMLNLLYNAFPMKQHQFHVLNAPYYFTAVYNIFKHFLPSKLRSRVLMHGSDLSQSLHKYVSPSILPESLGGILTDEEAFDSDFERRIVKKEEFYKQFADLL